MRERESFPFPYGSDFPDPEDERMHLAPFRSFDCLASYPCGKSVGQVGVGAGATDPGGARTQSSFAAHPPAARIGQELHNTRHVASQCVVAGSSMSRVWSASGHPARRHHAVGITIGFGIYLLPFHTFIHRTGAVEGPVRDVL